MKYKKQIKKMIWVIGILAFTIGFPSVFTLFFSGKVENTEYDIQKCGKYVIIEGKKMDIEEYLIGILSAASMECEDEEYQKMMCILFRSMLYQKMGAQESIAAEETGLSYLDEEGRKEKWKGDTEKYEKRWKKIIAETSGRILTSGGEVVSPQYHYLSNGTTREGISCPDDLVAHDYLKTAVYSYEAFLELLSGLNPEVAGNEGSPLGLVQILNRDIYGYVNQIAVGSVEIPVQDFMEKFQMISPSFELDEYNGGIRILTKGEGEGYGISLYTAKQMAEDGKKTEEILTFFFPDCSIEKAM